MIAEYGIIPDVFDPTGYSSHEVCDLRLSQLKDCLLGRGVVRNFRNGEWWRCVEDQRDRWHNRAKELLKKLKQQGRLRETAACLPDAPKDGREWCLEAMASHKTEPLQGIIADDVTASAHVDKTIVSAISRLGQAAWWQRDSCSVELRRDAAEYLKMLAPVLRHSNSLMFIDPHLDPSEKRYQNVVQLLQACGSGNFKPQIEIHRVCYAGSGPSRRILSEVDLKRMFAGPVQQAVVQRGLRAEVFIWDDFHDRFLISNLLGIMLPNGFDVETGPATVTRWARLDQKDRDNVQREFDPAAGQHQPRYRFKI